MLVPRSPSPLQSRRWAPARTVSASGSLRQETGSTSVSTGQGQLCRVLGCRPPPQGASYQQVMGGGGGGGAVVVRVQSRGFSLPVQQPPAETWVTSGSLQQRVSRWCVGPGCLFLSPGERRTTNAHPQVPQQPHPAASSRGRDRIRRPVAQSCPRIQRSLDCHSIVSTLPSSSLLIHAFDLPASITPLLCP